MTKHKEYRITFWEYNSAKYVISDSLDYFSTRPHSVGRAAYSSLLLSEIAFVTARTRRPQMYGRQYL